MKQSWVHQLFTLFLVTNLSNSFNFNSLSTHSLRSTDFQESIGTEPCSDGESNSSHILWPSSSPSIYSVEWRNATERECLSYLREHLMPFDVPNAQSLGFPKSGDEPLPDGLSSGLVGPTIRIALDAKKFPWTRDVPKELYLEYVLNFCNVNEARTNWRPVIYDALMPFLQPLLDRTDEVEIQEVVKTVNTHLWNAFDSTKEIVFKAGQTPMIYDPMSILVFGYASCTGISILLIDALRTVGIPARLAGTPAWNGDKDKGNHSWVEIYDATTRQWYILEATPAAGRVVEDYTDPCQFWFCTPDRTKDTKFYAARLDGKSGVYFPMAWDDTNQMVQGEDRTAFMTELCARC